MRNLTISRSKRGAFLPRLIATILLLLCVVLTGCQAGSTSGKYDYRTATLDNGLRVITLEDFSCPIVSVQLWYHVGSKDDQPNRRGFAHLFEHMMFLGTDRLSSTDHDDLIRRTGGTSNAYTTFDQTVYYEVLPANQLDLALWLEAERMALLRIDEHSFQTERNVVAEERRLRVNGPYGTLFEQAQTKLYKVHPYRSSVLGKGPDLEAANVEELRDFWRKYYVPNNATLVIAGAVKHEQAQNTAAKLFGWIPRGPAPPRITIREPMPTKRRTVTIREKNSPAPLRAVVFRTVPAGHDDAKAIEMLAMILGQGNSSRLHRRLVAKDRLAMQMIAFDYQIEHDGLLAIGAVLPVTGGKPKQVLAAIDEEIDRIAREGISEKELTKARNRMLRGLITRDLHVSSKASALGYAAVMEGSPARVNERLTRLRAVTVADLQRVAKKYLRADRALVLHVPRNLLGSLLSIKSSAKTIPVTAKPETQPKPIKVGLDRPANFPAAPPVAELLKTTPDLNPTVDVLPNGLRVLVVENHEVPFVTIRLGLRMGDWSIPKAGVASMTMNMLTKGTASHSEAQLAEALETRAISLSAGAGADTSQISASCLTEQLPQAMSFLAEVALTPTFPENEFHKLRKRIRTGLAIRAAGPSYQASRELRKRLYGTHTYARTATGEPADLDALKIDDLKKWHSLAVRPDAGVLIFAGDIDRKKALQLTKQYLGQWQGKGEIPKPQLSKFPTPGKTRIYLVDRPGSVQSQIRIGQLGLTRKDADYFTSRVISDYFGGSFSSRLNEAVRVKKGLTYGAWGGFGARRFAGSFTASTHSKTAGSAEALQTLLDEIQRLLAERPTVEELSRTRQYSLGSYARNHETPQSVAGEQWLIEAESLPRDFFQQRLKHVTTVTPEKCLRVARKYIQSDSLVIVVVGDAEKLRDKLEKIAPVTVVELSKDK